MGGVGTGWIPHGRGGGSTGGKFPWSGRDAGHPANVTALHANIRQTAVRQAAEFIDGDPVVAPSPIGAEEVHVRLHTRSTN